MTESEVVISFRNGFLLEHNALLYASALFHARVRFLLDIEQIYVVMRKNYCR